MQNRDIRTWPPPFMTAGINDFGSIRTLQRILRRPISEETELRQHDLATLQQMRQELETALADSPWLS